MELPKSFLNSVESCAGFDLDNFVEAHQKPSPTSIRLNPFKQTPLNFTLDNPVLWNKSGFYLKERPNFTHDLLFQAGCYYVQEAGSMFIEHALKSCVDFDQQLLALDVCAAPGGKSTLLNSLLNNESTLVANEIIKQRSQILEQNICKWGTANVVITNNDPAMFAEVANTFDVVLVDAPCSGSGLFRKQADAIDEWSLDNVNLCCQRQKRILSDIIPSLKPDGTLVYSTCSYSAQENEAIADWLITEFKLVSVKIPIEKNWGIVETESEIHKSFGYRFYPDKTNSEGFFCAVFKKQTDEQPANYRKTKYDTFEIIKPKEKIIFEPWIQDLSKHEIVKFKDDYLLVNQLTIDFINKYKHLYFKKVGTTIGSLAKNSVVPHHDLALSVYLKDDVNKTELDNETAILFMKKELLQLDGNIGWSLITTKNFGLGWVKNLGNRFNNYLPNEFRILK